MQIRFLRLPQVIERTASSRSTVYASIKSGLLPPPIRLAPQSVGWAEHELNEVLKARFTAKTDDEIRALVKQLIEARSLESAAA